MKNREGVSVVGKYQKAVDNLAQNVSKHSLSPFDEVTTWTFCRNFYFSFNFFSFFRITKSLLLLAKSPYSLSLISLLRLINKIKVWLHFAPPSQICPAPQSQKTPYILTIHNRRAPTTTINECCLWFGACCCMACFFWNLTWTDRNV